ncbi:MAG: cupredoxin domain-containing protein [Candidatus Saccharibacteria bacterium]
MKYLLCLGLILSAAVMAPRFSAIAQTSPAGQASIQLTDDAFGPANLNILAGTAVTWTNQGMHTHTVTSDSGAFGSGNLSPGQQFSFTFNSPGIYPYYCRFHGAAGGIGMSGVITVVASGQPSPAASQPGNSRPEYRAPQTGTSIWLVAGLAFAATAVFAALNKTS